MNLFALVLESGEKTIFDEPKAWLESHGVNILIIILGAWVLRRVTVALLIGVLNRAIRHHSFASETDRKKRIDTLDSLLSTASKIIFGLVAVIMIVDELGINTAPLLASAGVVGVAFGIGAQSLIKDFTNGLFIIIENQYRVGDVIQLEVAGGQPIPGTVEAITVRTTIIRDIKGVRHHVPNGSIVTASNKTFGYSKLNEMLVVDTATDVTKLEKVINAVGEELVADEELGKLIRKTPILAQIQGYSELGLTVFIRGETVPGGQWKVQSELFKRLQLALAKAKIKVATAPFPMQSPATKKKP
ncbi:mechanosensitive ion channel [Candidatus Saccharibacteria bacterium]|nr:MAG: mechanosensitive ion channel [Candidatus Saccharibacteria bacterium]